MRRYVLGEQPGLDAWQIVDAPDAPLGSGEVRVEMRAWSLNYRDLMVAKGTYGGKYTPGLVPLSDGAGEVVEIGSGVTELRVGDRVATCFFEGWQDGPLTPAKGQTARGGAVDGVLVERLVAGETSLVKIPDHLSFQEAATLPCAGLTAWNALFHTARLLPGETVLVQGTGGVSMLALQMAKAAGARVIATSSRDEKLARAKGLGADEGINYRENPDWERAAYELTGGAGVDVIVEVGGGDTLPRSLKAAATGGRIAVIGVLTGGTVELPIGYMLMKNLQVTGIYVGSRRQFQEMNRALEVSDVQPIIGETFPFDRAAEALSRLASGEHFGKVVVSRG